MSDYAANAEARQILDSANRRIVSAEIRAAAIGRLADPSDALALIDASAFQVGDDGSVDADAVRAAVDSLVASKPYLSMNPSPRFEGSADGGARGGDANSVGQLSRADLRSMTPEQIVEARQKGRCDRLLGN